MVSADETAEAMNTARDSSSYKVVTDWPALEASASEDFYEADAGKQVLFNRDIYFFCSPSSHEILIKIKWLHR